MRLQGSDEPRPRRPGTVVELMEPDGSFTLGEVVASNIAFVGERIPKDSRDIDPEAMSYDPWHHHGKLMDLVGQRFESLDELRNTVKPLYDPEQAAIFDDPAFDLTDDDLDEADRLNGVAGRIGPVSDEEVPF